MHEGNENEVLVSELTEGEVHEKQDGVPNMLQKRSRAGILCKERGSWRAGNGASRSQLSVLSTDWLYASASSTGNLFSLEKWIQRAYCLGNSMHGEERG